MRKFFLILLTTVFVFTNISGIFAAPDIYGEAYILIDGKSGQVLLEHEIHKKLHPASTTKILTTIIALEKSKLSDIVTISKNVPLVEGTKVYLREGEKITLEKLLNAVMLHSANDAALAVAEHIAGTQEKFAGLMNEKAQEIGAKESTFVNPHGLTDENHLTTAYDLALLARYAMQNPQFRELAAKKVYDWEGEEWQTRLINKNKFLWRMDEATGVKMGYTSEAKYTVVASAQKDNRELIAVILGSNDNRIWDDARDLLNYGLEHFQNLSLAQNNQVVATIKMKDNQEINLISDRSASIAVANNAETNVERKLVLDEIETPIEEGKVLGQLVISVNGEEKERIPVKAAEGVKKPFPWNRVIINTLAGIFLLQITWRITRRFRRKRTTMFNSYGRRGSPYR
ncbi:MAG: D-alanyl-D-alanine carboxypeptidase family protein [Peptococcaceae bacterium]